MKDLEDLEDLHTIDMFEELLEVCVPPGTQPYEVIEEYFRAINSEQDQS